MNGCIIPRLAGAAGLALTLAAPQALAWPNDPTVNVPLCTRSATQLAPSIAGDGAGGAFVTWADARGTDPDIYLQHVTASGAIAAGWPANGLLVCGAAGVQDSPVLVSDGSGGAIVAWEDSRQGGQDVYAVRVGSDGAIASGWTVGGTLLCGVTGDQGDLDLIEAGGGAIVAWWDSRADDGDIYALRVTGSGAIASGWTADGTPLCAVAGAQTGPGLVTDGSGGAIVAWQDARGADQDLYAMRVTSGGAPGQFWPADGAPVCVAAGDQWNPVIVTDGNHGAFVVWDDWRGPESDIYARRLTRTGGVAGGWDPDGAPVCSASWYQGWAHAVPDGSGGIIVAWQDARDPEDVDVYAQRMDGAGNLAAGWPVDGTPLVAGLGFQGSPEIASDGAGGAIVAWRDQRGGATFDIFAQRVTAAGATAAGWASDGVAISIAANDQLSSAIVADGQGGAILCWQDTRDSPQDDLYAQRVGPDGALGATVGVPAPGGKSFELGPVYPSPARRTVTIRYGLARESEIALTVLDVAGRKVRELERGTRIPGGHRTAWDLRDAAGGLVAPGVYRLVLRVEAWTSERALTVVR